MSIVSSPWATYVRELDDVEVYETIEGFALYKIRGDEAYIQDIWVQPDYRQTHASTTIANHIAELARKANCKYLTGSVRPTANNSARSMQVLLNYGMVPHSTKDNLVYFVKSLETK